MRNLFNYIDRPSPIHALTGATKFLCLVLWSFGAMSSYDTRLLTVLPIVSLVLFYISKIKLKDVSFMLGFTAAFMVMNNILVYLFSPQHGVEIYGTCHVILGNGRYALTQEQLFYHLNYFLKYLSTIPIVLLFVCTTDPSEFAASLNKIGVKYSIAYSVALALRYIPDVQREYHEISQAQQARGIEMSSKAGIISRLKSASAILVPLILSSMDKIEVVSNAMELRGFGKNKKRTWYRARKFRPGDIISIAACVLIVILSFLLTYLNGSRFYNPFM